MLKTKNNPAEEASVACLKSVITSIKNKKHFLVEAGAGAGKTYTLIKALKFLIEENGDTYIKTNKRIACITYTNVAKDEIRSRTDNHPIIFADTIHAFCWELMKDFQQNLRSMVPALSEKWGKRCEEIGGVVKQEVIYNLGFPKATDTELFLHHDDVIALMSILIKDVKFRRILKAKFPVIFVDEYQDTNIHLAASIVSEIIVKEEAPLIGFFGDHWQKIYGSSSCGLIVAPGERMETIGKNANFRSDRLLVEVLNRIRPELPQHVCDPESIGEVNVFTSNGFTGERRTEAHWKDDLPEETAHDYLEEVKSQLSAKGWEFDPEKTKILMLTNNVLATEQGYNKLIKIFSNNEDLLKKSDDYISFLADVVLACVESFECGKYGEMFEALNLKALRIKRHDDKEKWFGFLTSLLECTKHKTIGEVLKYVNESNYISLPPKLSEKERRYASLIDQEEMEEADKLFFEKIKALKEIPFKEIGNVNKYIDDKTLFSTKHGVKGAEFENVLVVLGRGWNLYNWNQMLEWVGSIPKGKDDTFERNRNLFYVACSRPQKRLAILFTQLLSDKALANLNVWFKSDPLHLSI